jgi:thiamine biosynthesis protein ThiS
MRGVTECQSAGRNPAETKEITIVLNGEPRIVPAGLNIRDLLDCLGLDASRVAVELNRTIVRQPEWTSTTADDGAQLEVVQFVGGG